MSNYRDFKDILTAQDWTYKPKIVLHGYWSGCNNPQAMKTNFLSITKEQAEKILKILQEGGIYE